LTRRDAGPYHAALAEAEPMALENKRRDPNFTIDSAIAAAITERLEGGLLSCAAALELAAQHGWPAAVVGATADAMEVRLTACQLGLFGYPGHAKGWEAAGVANLPAPAGLDEALGAARNQAGELTCLGVWSAAQSAGCSRIQAGCVADRNGIKIRGCQLGAF
jgi:hypothetical protein